MAGLLQKFVVESDTQEQLVHAIRITQKWNSKVTHYKTGVDDNNVPYIKMQWHESGGGVKLIAPMTDAEAIAEQLYSWLKTTGYSGCYSVNGDGDDVKGWMISTVLENIKPYDQNTDYDVFVFQPTYIYYSK